MESARPVLEQLLEQAKRVVSNEDPEFHAVDVELLDQSVKVRKHELLFAYLMKSA